MSTNSIQPKYSWRDYPADEIPSSTEPPTQLTNSIRRGELILDIGCGVGKSTIPLARVGHRISGIDINPRAIAKAIADAGSEGLNIAFQTADATNLHGYRSESFDSVLMQAFLTTLSTAKERTHAIDEAFRVLKVGGRLFMVEFLQNWSSSSYRDRYIHGLKLGFDTGTFPVHSEKDGALLYLARHFEVHELVALGTISGFEVEAQNQVGLTSRSGKSTVGIELTLQKPKSSENARVFAVSITYSHVNEQWVSQLAQQLESLYGKSRIGYDRYHPDLFARPVTNNSNWLDRLYGSGAELIVVVLSQEYLSGQYTSMEWDLVRRVAQSNPARIFFVTDGLVNPGSLHGISLAGHMSTQEHGVGSVVEGIKSRYREIRELNEV